MDVSYPLAPLLLAGQGPGQVRGRRRLPAGPARRRGIRRLRPAMFLDLTQRAARAARRAAGLLRQLISAGEREAMLTERHGTVYREVVRRMGRDGWLGVGWPAEFGGRGLGQMEQQIFVSEAARADVPLPSVTLQTVGPTLQAHGTAEQKEFFLPQILAGEVHFAIGYTEPEAGTDLAALRTRAVRDGETYVVNGQKIFTTGAHDADYIWLACRTDPDAPRHKGHLDPHRRHHRPRLLLDADHHPRRRPSRQRDLLLRRARPGDDAGRRGERGLAAGDHPAQPRAGDARPGGPDRRAARPGARVGGGSQPRRTAARCSACRTCGVHWPRPTPACASTSCSTGRSRWRRRWTWPTRRPPRCSARSGCSGSASCSRTSSGGTAIRPTRGHGRAAAVAGHPGQAEYGADLRRRGQRDPARADRDRRARPAAGTQMNGGA